MLGLGGRYVGPPCKSHCQIKKRKKKLAFCTLSDGTTQPASIYTFLFRSFRVKSNAKVRPNCTLLILRITFIFNEIPSCACFRPTALSISF